MMDLSAISKIAVERATAQDYRDMVDEANLIFTVTTDETGRTVYDDHFFQTLVPKLYRDETRSMPSHYLVRENGKIVAMAGAFENTLTVLDKTLTGRGIGTVGVDPACRSKGYMKAIMHRMLEDCRTEGVDFAYLGGLRQRYEHFGFSSAGVSTKFVISGANMDYIYGKNAQKGYSFVPVEPQMDGVLDAIWALYQTRIVRACRPRTLLYDILINWNRTPVAIYRDHAFAGYCITGENNRMIYEIVLVDESHVGEALNDFIRHFLVTEVTLTEIGLYEREKINYLALCAESFSLVPHEQFRFFNFRHMIDAYLTLKASYVPLCDGVFSVDISNEEKLRIAVADNHVSVEPFQGVADVTMDSLLAAQVFFGVGTLMTDFGLALPAPARQWFPLPLCYPEADGV